MSLILSIETSTHVSSVALHREGQLLALSELFIEKSHARYLTTCIDQVISQSGYTLEQLDAVAVSSGPGSYTGLRIGVSTAKGICFALNKPLIAVSTLEAMAAEVSPGLSAPALLCPMIDARRMEVYCALYNSALIELEPIQAKIIDEQAFIEVLKDQRIVFFGNGAAKCQSVITSANAVFFTHIQTSARGIGLLAYEKFKLGKIEDLAYFEPFYLKEFRIGAKA